MYVRRSHVQGDQPHSLLPFLYRALGAVVTLLLWGQLFAVELGNDAMDFEGESLGFPRSYTPQLS
jgi:hypothetical protein